MTIHIIELSYSPYKILDLFQSLSKKEWSMLLYSGHKNQNPDSRFDILVSSPILTLTTKNNITNVHCHNKNIFYNNVDPFSLIKKYLYHSSANIDFNLNHQLPFQGGFMGIFGYELIKHFEKSLPKLKKTTLFCPDMAIGLYNWTIISDHKKCKSFLVSQNDPKKLLSWIKKQKNTKHSINNIKLFNIKNFWKSNISKSDYKKKFKIIKENLNLGKCYQVCLSQQFTTSYSGDEWIAFRYLLNYNHSPFSAFIRLPNNTVVLSFSPERFLKLKNSNIQTQPIKGTIPRLKNIKSDNQQITNLLNSSKNQAENLMIVDLLRNDLGQVAIPGTIHVPKLFNIQSLPNIHHMVSTITAKLSSNFSACDLLRACFPGGSITGAPKIEAMKLIEILEPHKRHIWSGSIGYLSYSGNMDTNIIIRTLLAERKKLFCAVGSGIVYDSNEDEEYQEMIEKVSTILLPLLKKFKNF